MTGTTVLTTGNTDYNALELIRACIVYTERYELCVTMKTAKHAVATFVAYRKGTETADEVR